MQFSRGGIGQEEKEGCEQSGHRITGGIKEKTKKEEKTRDWSKRYEQGQATDEKC